MTHETEAQQVALHATVSGDVIDTLTAQIQRIQSTATQLTGAIDNLSGLVGGTGSDIYTNANTLLSDVNSSAANVQAAVDSLSTLLVNNTNFSTSLYTQATTQSNTLDSGVASLPNAATYATVGSSAASDGMGGVNIQFSSGLGSANGTYNLSSSAISGGIPNGGQITLTNGSNNVVLYNRSGSMMSTQSQVITYLTGMYPVSSKLATCIADKISALNTQVGGLSQSLRAKIATVDAALLQNPTGVVATDLTTARNVLVPSLGRSLQTDIASVNAGIGAANASNSNSVWGDISTFQNATTTYDQLNAFLALFDPSNWTNAGNSSITFTISGSAPASLGDLISAAASTS